MSFISLKIQDFLGIKPTKDVRNISKYKNNNYISFVTDSIYVVKQFYIIEYFYPKEMDTIKLLVYMRYKEFIDESMGYFYGARVVDIESGKESIFNNLFHKK